MKKITAIALLAAMLGVNSCGNTKLSEEEARNHTLDDSLQVALANADSLFSLLYDVTAGMEQITRLEKLMGTEMNTESTTARANIAKQMEAIQKGLIDRRKRIEELEAQLANTNGGNSKLRQQIEVLRQQIDSQAAMVADLQQKLEAANIHIARLDSTIVDLNTTVDTIAAAKAKTQAELDQTISDLNAVYYVIGTDKELKEHNIIQGGGLFSKAKVLPSDFDQDYLTRADRRSLSVIPLDAKKAKVLTAQPEDSYRFDKSANGTLSLVITQPAAFWAASRILVVKTN